MLEILKAVAAKRLDANKSNYTIQLSAILMSKAISDVEKLTNTKVYQVGMGTEFQYAMFGEIFTVRNRAYRDDTNDPDVEEVLYEEAMIGLLRKEKPTEL